VILGEGIMIFKFINDEESRVEQNGHFRKNPMINDDSKVVILGEGSSSIGDDQKNNQRNSNSSWWPCEVNVGFNNPVEAMKFWGSVRQRWARDGDRT
jgi:hypothetical protein